MICKNHERQSLSFASCGKRQLCLGLPNRNLTDCLRCAKKAPCWKKAAWERKPPLLKGGRGDFYSKATFWNLCELYAENRPKSVENPDFIIKIWYTICRTGDGIPARLWIAGKCQKCRVSAAFTGWVQMNPLMNPVGSNAEGKLNCINAVVITHKRTVILIQCIGLRFFCYFTPYAGNALAI